MSDLFEAYDRINEVAIRKIAKLKKDKDAGLITQQEADSALDLLLRERREARRDAAKVKLEVTHN